MKVEVKEIGSMKLDRINKVLAGIPGGVMSASHNALKRAAARAKTEAGRMAAEEYAISKSSFMKNVTVSSKVEGGGFGKGTSARISPSGSITSLSVSFRGSVIPLLEFNTRFSPGGRLTTQVKRGGTGGELKRAFAARINNRLRVMERVGDSRLPIDELFGPSAAQMMANPAVEEKMRNTINDAFNERIEHEIWRLLSGLGG